MLANFLGEIIVRLFLSILHWQEIINFDEITSKGFCLIICQQGLLIPYTYNSTCFLSQLVVVLLFLSLRLKPCSYFSLFFPSHLLLSLSTNVCVLSSKHVHNSTFLIPSNLPPPPSVSSHHHLNLVYQAFSFFYVIKWCTFILLVLTFL
jgi:hypothetical protein